MMNDGFIVDLPAEANNTQWTVHAPAGGLADKIHLLLADPTVFIDLDVRQGFRYGHLRIWPGDHIDRDSRNPTKYLVSDGVAVFLDELGNEHSENIHFGGSLFTEAVHAGSPTGVITLWKQPRSELHNVS